MAQELSDEINPPSQKKKKKKKKKEKEKKRSIHYSDCPTANGAKLAAFECGSFQSPRPIAMPYI